ncbi:MAG: hypothetical protein HC837_09495 [Chloroflexaceae bacterium]|nr:hypothetical protein [Chloroflexaceae bacterium]
MIRPFYRCMICWLLLLAGCSTISGTVGDGAIPTHTVLPVATATPTANSAPVASHPTSTLATLPTPTETLFRPDQSMTHDIVAPLDWYTWQGYWRDGELEPASTVNCGPATVAMAVRYASHNQHQPTPEQVRDTIPELRGVQRGTYPRDMKVALDAWQVPWQSLTTPAQIIEAIGRDHIVLVPVDMRFIALEQDDPTNPIMCSDAINCTTIGGRYYAFDGRHVVAAKGLIYDPQQDRYHVVVYDPNVWGGNPAYYYAGDGRFPKGINRLYVYEQFMQAFASTGFDAIEILATPWQPIVIENGELPAPVEPQIESQSFWCSQSNGQLTTLAYVLVADSCTQDQKTGEVNESICNNNPEHR